jgi:hypothetical protein
MLYIVFSVDRDIPAAWSGAQPAFHHSPDRSARGGRDVVRHPFPALVVVCQCHQRSPGWRRTRSQAVENLFLLPSGQPHRLPCGHQKLCSQNIRESINILEGGKYQ